MFPLTVVYRLKIFKQGHNERDILFMHMSINCENNETKHKEPDNRQGGV